MWRIGGVRGPGPPHPKKPRRGVEGVPKNLPAWWARAYDPEPTSGEDAAIGLWHPPFLAEEEEEEGNADPCPVREPPFG